MIKSKLITLIAIGGAAGLVNGMFGTGGGTVMVLGLTGLLRDLESKELFANVCASVLPVAVTSALTYSAFAPPDMGLAVTVGTSALAGGAVGALLLGRLGGRVVRIIFAAVMIVGGGIMVMR